MQLTSASIERWCVCVSEMLIIPQLKYVRRNNDAAPVEFIAVNGVRIVNK